MEQNQESSLFGLSIDTNSKAHLAEAARWAKFLAIVGFIMCGLIVIAGIFSATALSFFSRNVNSYESGTGFNLAALGPIISIVYILAALLYFFPTLFLYRFAINTKTALASNDQETMNASFQNLKKMFRFVGILTLIILSFYVIFFIIAIVVAGASGLR